MAHAGGVEGSAKADGLDACVAPTPFMRRSHFELIKHQRDITVHEGIRKTDNSLAGCIDCHVRKDVQGQHVAVNASGEFCAACHVEDVDLLPDATAAMATTVEAGAPPFRDQLNDVLQGAQTTSCVTCHADSASRGHAYQNGWTPQEFEEGRKTIIDAN